MGLLAGGMGSAGLMGGVVCTLGSGAAMIGTTLDSVAFLVGTLGSAAGAGSGSGYVVGNGGGLAVAPLRI